MSEFLVSRLVKRGLPRNYPRALSDSVRRIESGGTNTLVLDGRCGFATLVVRVEGTGTGAVK